MKKFLIFIVIGVITSLVSSTSVNEPGTGNRPGASSIDWPNSRAGQCAKAYITAFNAKDDDAVRSFYKKNKSPSSLKKRSVEDRLSQVRLNRSQLGKLKVVALKVYSDLDVEVIVQPAKIEMYLGFRFKMEEKPPHYLDSIIAKPTSPPDTKTGEYHDWKDLQELVEKARSDSGAPALAVAVVRGGKIMESAVAGIRQLGKPDPVELGDRFHIGSITKSVTATMIGKLVEDGVLKWDMSLGEVFPDMKIKPVYRNVTLELLLRHLGGVQPYQVDVNFDVTEIVKANPSPTEQRAAFTAHVLKEEPAAKPGQRMVYSNAGYTVAAYIAERVSKQSWENLIQQVVLTPFELKSSGIGYPAAANSPDQPRGHFGKPSELRVQAVGEDSFDYWLRPAGDIHCSIEDLGRYAAFHLQGLRGQDGILKAETVRRLHTAPASDSPIKYAAGWLIDVTDDGEPVHYHAGSGGWFFAQVSLFPKSDLAIVVAVNAGIYFEPTVRRVIESIYRRMKKTTKK
jgi:CubicO group peptidase (beta-lactamase class C family)